MQYDVSSGAVCCVLWRRCVALEQMVEEVEPCRQELVSFGVDMGVYLESYFKQARTLSCYRCSVVATALHTCVASVLFPRFTLDVLSWIAARCCNQVREAMTDKAGVLSAEEVEDMEAQLRVRVGEQRNRSFQRIAAQHAAWEHQQLDTMAFPQVTQGDISRTSINERALGN